MSNSCVEFFVLFIGGTHKTCVKNLHDSISGAARAGKEVRGLRESKARPFLTFGGRYFFTAPNKNHIWNDRISFKLDYTYQQREIEFSSRWRVH